MPNKSSNHVDQQGYRARGWETEPAASAPKITTDTERPSVLQTVVAVHGGGLDSQFAWVLKPTLVDGKTFADIYGGSQPCRDFRGNNFKTVNHVKELRNTKVYELMQEQNKEGEPAEEHAQHNGNLRPGPKRELIDLLPPIITLDVSTASSMVTSVNVLPPWRTKGVLQIELTQPNLDLLMEDPSEDPAEPAPWVPEIEHPRVQWIPSRNMFHCTWWDSKKSRERHVGVAFSGDVDDADKHAIVDGAAKYLQQLYDNSNNPEDNCACDPSGEAEFEQMLSVQRLSLIHI